MCLFILGWLNGKDVEREVARLGPGEVDRADVDVGVGVDELDEKLLDILVLVLTDLAFFFLLLLLLLFLAIMTTGHGRVGGLDIVVGHVGLVELHVLLLHVAWNSLTGDRDGLLITDLLFLGL